MTVKKLLRLDAVLFDLDGTLVDTAPDFVLCIEKFCAAHDKVMPDEKAFRSSISYGAKAMVECALNISREDENFNEYVDEFLDIYLNNVAHKSVLFPSLDDLIIQLEKHQIPWGIVTNKSSVYAAPLVKALKLKPGCLVCPDHVAKAKPDPEPMHLACKQMKIKAEHCLYIGDHLRDIEAGRSAKMHTVAAAYGYIDKDDSAANWQADYYAAKPEKIERIIRQHFESW